MIDKFFEILFFLTKWLLEMSLSLIRPIALKISSFVNL